MKLSTKGRYGLRALIDLALYSENEAASIASISARQQLKGPGGEPGRGQLPGASRGRFLRRLGILRDEICLAED